MSPELLSRPADDILRTAHLGGYLEWLAKTQDRHFESNDELWAWSVADLEGFWGSIWDYFGVISHSPHSRILGRREMPGAQWFPGATLNYAEHILAREEADPDRIAVIAESQTRPTVQVSIGELREQVARARVGLQGLGVGRGDRVVAYLPNIPETLVAFLATVSLGAIWAVCAPEFGPRSAIDRFSQVEPVVLLAVAGYRYGAKDVDRTAEVAALRADLPTLRHVVHIPYGAGTLPDAVEWSDLLAQTAPIEFEAVPFDHPLCVLFSSGTTGKPKAIVHGHGGLLIEQLKTMSLSWDLGPGSRLLWFTTTAWMMWNALVGALLTGASIVMIDGNPLHPDLRAQWELTERTGATLMGASPGYLMSCRKEGIHPAREFGLSRLQQIGVAGSPLPAEGSRWLFEEFGSGVLVNLGCGGTDVCTGLLAGSPWQSVWAGEMSGPCLGVDAKAFDKDGHQVVGELGELVITSPMPSMPVGFWGDADKSLYTATYFTEFPGVWRQGDWARFSAEGSVAITGRSDATLNRGGVRLGTGDFYRVVEELPEVTDSLVLHIEDPNGGNGELLLFVVLRDGGRVTPELYKTLSTLLRTSLSPRHIPDTITAVPSVPRNRTGKKLELPAKKVLLGQQVSEVAGPDVLVDPTSLDAFVALAATRASARRIRVTGAIERVAIIGTGVIGASWTAYFLAHGLDVLAADPAPGAQTRLRLDVEAHWPALIEMGLAPGASLSRLSFVTSIEAAVEAADFVQENGPERIELKHEVVAAIDREAAPHVVIASSSSGLRPSDIAAGCPEHPERLLIGHPFNPPHLIPLVEVVPGARTSDEALATAMSFYAEIGKRPIHVRAELPGHLTNRLQAALWREAYSLVERGAASVADIDAAIAWGPGLRWSLMGPMLNQHLSGGPGGFRHVMEHLGPPMVDWWNDLQQPEFTPELINTLVAGVDAECAGMDPQKLAAERDRLLVELLRSKAGATDFPQ